MDDSENRDKVRVHYTGKLDDGEVFDSSEGGTPLAFTVGDGQVIPGFDNGVIGMAPGDSRTVNIPFVDAYGEHHDDGVMEVPRNEFPDDMEFETGSRVQGQQSDGPWSALRSCRSPTKRLLSTPTTRWPAKT